MIGLVMTAAELRTERRRGLIRDEVVEVAWRLADELGVAGVTLKNVAERMEIRPPSLYQYLPNLNGLFDLMFRAGWEQLGVVIDGVDSETVSVYEAYELFIEFCV